MVILKNITKTNDDISADYYIEGKEPKGFMRINVKDKNIIEHKDAGYGSSHVRRELVRLIELDNVPKEKVVFWF